MYILIKFRAAGSVLNLHIYKMQTKEHSLYDLECVSLLDCSPMRLSAGGGSDALLQSFRTQQIQGDKSRLGWRREWRVYIILYHHNYCHANVIIQTINMMNYLKSQCILVSEAGLCCGNHRLSLRNINLERAINK